MTCIQIINGLGYLNFSICVQQCEHGDVMPLLFALCFFNVIFFMEEVEFYGRAFVNLCEFWCPMEWSLIFCVGGMAMYVGESSLELSTYASSSDGEFPLSSSLTGSVDKKNVDVVSPTTSSHESFEVHKQSLHLGEDHDNIPLCAGFGREQWVGLDVVLLDEAGVPVADGICRKSDPRECVDANPLDLHLNPLEVLATWRFSLR